MMFKKTTTTLGIFFSVCMWFYPAISFSADSGSTGKLSDQRMAESPEALIDALGEISFLTPEQMKAKL